MHLNLADFYYQNSHHIITYILHRIWHTASQDCCYSMQINLWWWANPKIRIYLILQFYSNRENLTLAKYTFYRIHFSEFIVLVTAYSSKLTGRAGGHWSSRQMHTDVSPQCGWTGEGLVTRQTRIRVRSVMRLFVRFEVSSFGERSLADFAGVRKFARVVSQVAPQHLQIRELLVADRAHIAAIAYVTSYERVRVHILGGAAGVRVGSRIFIFLLFFHCLPFCVQCSNEQSPAKQRLSSSPDNWKVPCKKLFLQCFDTVGWVIWPVKTRARYDLCVWWDVKPYSINQSIHARSR